MIERGTTALLGISHDLGSTWSTLAVGGKLSNDRTWDAHGTQSPDGTIRATLTAQRQVGDDYVDEWDVVGVRHAGPSVEHGQSPTAPGIVERYGTIELAASDHGVYWRTETGTWQLVEGLAAPDGWDTAFDSAGE